MFIIKYIKCVTLQEVTLSERLRGPLQCLRFLTLCVNSINEDTVKMRSRRETLAYLMRMDEWDVVYLQGTHHDGDGNKPSYVALFEDCGYKGG